MKVKISLRIFFVALQLVLSFGPLIFLGYFISSQFNRILGESFELKDRIILHSVGKEVTLFSREVERILPTLSRMLENPEIHRQSQSEGYVSDFFELFPYINGVELLNRVGDVIGSFPFNLQVIRNSRRGTVYFQEVLRTGKTFWSTSFLSPVTFLPTVNVSQQTGQNFLAASLNLERFSDLNLHGQEWYPDHLEVSILDSRGVYIADEDYGRVERQEQVPGFLEIKRRMENKESRFIMVQDQAEWLLGVQFVPDPGWYVVVRQPVKEAFSGQHEIDRLFIILMTLWIGLFLLINFISLALITNPLVKLNHLTGRVAGGQYNPVHDFHSFSELESLAGSFNSMIQKIKERDDVLKAQNAELERFTYTVSHDLKSPLITIKGFLGFVRDGLAKQKWDRVDSDLAKISSAADKMQNLLDDLLEMSRIGRIVNPMADIDLGKIIQEVLDLLAGPLSEKEAIVRQPSIWPRLRGDAIRIREVWQNLIENALKYSVPGRTPELELGFLLEGDYYKLYVKDNGMGIDPAFHQKVFGLFEQLDPHAEGTGIGLALVRRIVEIHGGQTGVHSTLGQGSTFWFTLPAAKGENPGDKGSDHLSSNT